MLLVTDISNIPGWLALVLVVILWGLVIGYLVRKFFRATTNKTPSGPRGVGQVEAPNSKPLRVTLGEPEVKPRPRD